MDLISKLKETLSSVLPIMAIVLIINFTIAPLGDLLWPFVIGGILLVIGLTLFIAGTDIGIVPVGEKLGSALAHKRNLVLMMVVGFAIGFGVIMAEPIISVFTSQVHSLNSAIQQNLLRIMIAIGLGLFVDIGLLRTVTGFKLRWVLILFYSIVFVLMGFIGQRMASISFDASGSTTGPLTVPFLLALGLGVSSATSHDHESSFGLTGISSIGPILAVAILAFSTSGEGSSGSVASVSSASDAFGDVILSTLVKTAIGFVPLAAIIVVLQFTLLHFPRIKVRRIILGLIYSFVGIVIFLTGVEYGFTRVGLYLGHAISSGYSPTLLILLSLLFGGIVVLAEPAVWVLTKQVEDVTAGRIKRMLVMVFLCIGVASAVALAMVRIVYHINYLWFVYIGVGLSLVLTFFTPGLFTGIAFDSGGVATGPMSTTFLFSYAIGASGSAELGFGLVGLIAISPWIAIQILGIIFRFKERRQIKGENNAASSK